jgi:hypothetical protein
MWDDIGKYEFVQKKIDSKTLLEYSVYILFFIPKQDYNQ